MNEWILFWKYLCGIGIFIYLVTLVMIIPLGARDIFRLFNTLRDRHLAEKPAKAEEDKKLDAP